MKGTRHPLLTRCDALLTHFARRVALGVAGWLARRCGYECVPRTEIVEARRSCADLCRYIRRSGHLTRAYHSGRKLRAGLGDIHQRLGRAWVERVRN